jgi:lysophospholipase L1-like esterase
MRLYRLLTFLGLLIAGMIQSEVQAEEPRDLLNKAKRVVFLGDSITYSGQYIGYLELWMMSQGIDPMPTVINVGLPSETVSGLSEDGHAGGQFPRPVLRERLDRVLALTKPDLVVACYGMNCGIYLPFDEARFAKYREGIEELKKKVEAMGAKCILVTPAYHDDLIANKPVKYNEVLDKYSDWLLSQRNNGWVVVDLHHAMGKEIDRRRMSDPKFTFQPDAVHPNEAGQWFIATQMMKAFGEKDAEKWASSEDMVAAKKLKPEHVGLFQQRMQIRRDAYLSGAGHKRPGMAAGLPVDQAEAKAAELTKEIFGK